MKVPIRRAVAVRGLLAAGLVAGAGLVVVNTLPAGAAESDGRQGDYAAAAQQYGVPTVVLMSVSYLESRWDTNAGTPSSSGGFGPMHLVDVDAVTVVGEDQGFHGAEDRRGDDSRTDSKAVEEADVPATAGPQTLETAAALTGLAEDKLRTDPATNIAGGAALLAEYQKKIGAPVGEATDPAQWYGAVARYAESTDRESAAAFADEVYSVLAGGLTKTTDDGHQVKLAATRVTPNKGQLGQLGLKAAKRGEGLECPAGLGCEWIPAPYQLLGDGTVPTSYGNHDLSDRPRRQKIEYIVIHDTEGYYDTTIRLAQDPKWVSWNYSIRSSDGHIAQHVENKDVAWHAGNWNVNAKGIGIEHEGFAAQGTWYTEAMYRSSAKLVRYLAQRYFIPLDRAHILGHDTVPGILPARIPSMHWDPGPYWDWAHYMELLGAPLRTTGLPNSNLVTIKPDFATNQPAFTGCTTSGVPCPARGSSSVILRQAPDPAAPLVKDIGLRPNGANSTMHISDIGARASTGQQYAVAERQGDWTAIWYLGQKGWFYNPRSKPAALNATGLVVTPKKGKATIPVYGRAYPEADAYPAGGPPVQDLVPLPYTFAAGQRYSIGAVQRSEYYRATTFDASSPGDWTVVRGDMWYVQIQFGHRVMYVNLADVDVKLAF